MTRDAALKQLVKMFGKNAYWRIGERQTSPERRTASQKAKLAAEFSVNVLKREMALRRQELVDADPYFQALKKDWIAKQAEADAVPFEGYRFEVGTREGIFTQPKAYGDTWEEVFAELKGEKS